MLRANPDRGGALTGEGARDRSYKVGIAHPRPNPMKHHGCLLGITRDFHPRK